MPNYVNCERSEKQPAADGEYGLFSHSTSIRVEYYRSFEYCLKWKRPMNSRRSSRLLNTSKRRSPSPNEDVIQRRLKGKRQRRAPRKTETGDSIVVRTDEGKNRDLLDIIISTCDAKHVDEEDEGRAVEMTTEGLDESDEDCVSVTSSIASGPSLLHQAAPKKPRSSQGLCSACKTRYQKAKKTKAPIKNKLLDNDPKSLTCDQWVLIKKWRPRRLPNARGKLLIHVQLVKKRLEVKNDATRPAQWVGKGQSSACWRPHTFLRRNLRRHVRLQVKSERKKNRRKRRRNSSQGPRVAKQQRLHSNNHGQNSSISSAGSHSSGPGFEACSDQEDTDLSGELFPTAVALDATEPREVPPRQEAPKKTCGFRDLLAQLRGNSSMIIRETR